LQYGANPYLRNNSKYTPIEEAGMHESVPQREREEITKIFKKWLSEKPREIKSPTTNPPDCESNIIRCNSIPFEESSSLTTSEMKLENFNILKWINSTPTAKIQGKKTNQFYIMKIVPSFLSEEKIHVLASLQHTNLVQYQGSFVHDFQETWGRKLCILYPFYKQNLQDKIVEMEVNKTGYSNQSKEQDEKHILKWFQELVAGLGYLHEKKIIHNKFKLSNIFLDESYNIKIGPNGFDEEDSQNSVEKNIYALGRIILDLLIKKWDCSYIEMQWEERVKLIPGNYSEKWRVIIGGLMDVKKQWGLKQISEFLIDFKAQLEKGESVITISDSNIPSEPALQKSDIINTFSLNLPSSKKVPKKNKDGVYQCEYPGCARVFPKRRALSAHRRAHTSFTPFVCRFCARPFIDNPSLERHERCHSENWRPYACPFEITCGKRFADPENLKTHIRKMHDESQESGIINIPDADAQKTVL